LRKNEFPQVHLAADMDRDGLHVGSGGGVDGSARKVGAVVIKKKKVDGLAARCMFGHSSSSSSSSENGPAALCIRTCKPFTVNVWSSGDFSLRDCPLSLMASCSNRRFGRAKACCD
jgi:hypothetical protein